MFLQHYYIVIYEYVNRIADNNVLLHLEMPIHLNHSNHPIQKPWTIM